MYTKQVVVHRCDLLHVYFVPTTIFRCMVTFPRKVPKHIITNSSVRHQPIYLKINVPCIYLGSLFHSDWIECLRPVKQLLNTMSPTSLFWRSSVKYRNRLISNVYLRVLYENCTHCLSCSVGICETRRHHFDSYFVWRDCCHYFRYESICCK